MMIQMKDSEGKEINVADEMWATAWTYIRTVVDTAREPFLILDRDLRVVAANSCFFRTFEVSEKETEGKLIYQLGNNQWDIPKLKKLLEEIVPKDAFFKDYEVDHEFPSIGRRIMVLNARQLFYKSEVTNTQPLPPLVLLAMEDVTDRRMIAEKLAEYAQQIENNLGAKMHNLDARVDDLTKLHQVIIDRDAQVTALTAEIVELKKQAGK